MNANNTKNQAAAQWTKAAIAPEDLGAFVKIADQAAVSKTHSQLIGAVSAAEGERLSALFDAAGGERGVLEYLASL